MDDQVAHVEKFQMRNGIINRQRDAAHGFGKLQRNLIQMPAEQQNAADHHKADGRVGGRRGKDERTQQGHGHHDSQHEPVQRGRLKIIQHRPMMIAAAGQHAEKNIKAQQRQPAGDPAAQKFSEHQLGARERLGQQRQQRPVFPLRRNLPRRGRDRDDQRRNPDQQQADLLQVADDLVIVVNVDRGHHQADQNGHDEQDIKILAPIQFLDDDTGDGKNISHDVTWG